jgi:hypothetical protein
MGMNDVCWTVIGLYSTILGDKVCQRFAAGRWFPSGTPVTSENEC